MAKVLEISLLVLACSALAVTAQSGCPAIIPRGGWTSRASSFISVLPIRPAPFVIVHPTGTDSCESHSECSASIRQIQTFHMDGNRWNDISYHFIIGSDLRVYAGRGWGRLGGNVGDFSNQAINVGLIGHFSDQPSAEIMELLDSLISCGISQRALAQDVSVIAQCQVTNMVSCEATTIFARIAEHPRFESNPRPV